MSNGSIYCRPPDNKETGQGFKACGGYAWCANLGNISDCWFGMNFDPEVQGQECADTYGVGLGCVLCDDLPDSWVRGVPTDGRRFLMPYRKFAPGASVLSGKDAHGNMHDLKSNEPWRVPLDIAYMRGNGWDNFGLECIHDACGYVRDTGADPDTGLCPEGEVVGEPLRGIFPDVSGFTGYHMPDPGKNMFVRFVAARYDPHVIEFERNYLYQANFHRTRACSANLLLGCLARIPLVFGCNCGASYARTFEGEQCEITNEYGVPRPNPGYYNASPQRQLYNFLRITQNNAQVRGAARPMFDFAGAALAVKNAVLSMIATQQLPGWLRPDGSEQPRVRMDQIHQNSRGVGLPEYEAWSRDWNLFLDGSLLAPDHALPVLAVPGGVTARLRQSQVAFDVEPVLLLATIELSMVAHAKFDRCDEPPCFIRVEPHIRMRVGGRWGLRLAEPVDFTTPAGRRITVSQENIYADPWPVVSGDEADYRVNGAALPRFQDVEWWGNLSSFSRPAVPDVVIPDTLSLNNACSSFLLEFNRSRIRVPGWPTYSDSFPNDPERNSIYAGTIGLEFPEA